MLGFFLGACLSLLIILLWVPEIYGRTLRLGSGESRSAGIVFFSALTGFLALLSTGVIKQWRWTFWLVLVAFLTGPLRVLASALQLSGQLQAEGPTWYVVLQGGLGIVQFVIGIAMWVGYRKAGRWGAF